MDRPHLANAFSFMNNSPCSRPHREESHNTSRRRFISLSRSKKAMVPELSSPMDVPEPDSYNRPPATTTFAFSIPDTLWKHKKASVMRWASDLPSIHSRQDIPEPAHIEGRNKHTLDPDDDENSDDDDDGDGHRHKRAKHRLSFMSPSKEKQPKKTSKGAANRVSSICQSLAGIRIERHSLSSLDGSTVNGCSSPSPPSTPSTACRPRMRFAFVGDSACGKSSLLLRFYRDAFNHSHVPTQYELFSKTTSVDGQDIDIEMWDTSGKVRLHQLKLLSYLAWDAVFLCFSVNSQRRFENARTKWAQEIRMYCRDAPVILLGLKKDLRSGPVTCSPLSRGVFETRVGASEGSMAAKILGAVKYLECSAHTGEGVNAVFEEGVRMVLDERAANEEAARMSKQKGKKMSTLGKIMCF